MQFQALIKAGFIKARALLDAEEAVTSLWETKVAIVAETQMTEVVQRNQKKMLNDVLIPNKNVTLKVLQSSNTDSCTAVSTVQLWKGKEDNEKDGS